jgi:HSP20 family protein
MATERRPARTFELAPWRAIDELQDRLRRWAFGEFVPPGTLTEMIGWTPPVELAEMDDKLVLTAELPGMKRKDIQVTLDGDVLTIRGEKKEEREEKEKRYHLWERRYGTFERSFSLPRTVDPQGIRARFEDGVLTIEMPKSKQARGQRIEVEGE